MNILVTGGAGYIGSHTCKALAKAGFTPVTYDNLSTGHAYAVKWGPFVQGDLNDREKLKEAFTVYKPTAVIHLAADTLIAPSVENPIRYYQNNVATTLSLLEMMLQCEVKRIVFSSCSATYGAPQQLPILETHPLLPITPHGRTKLMIEQMLQDFEKAYGMSAVCLRYFNAAGADLETQVGENHTPETHLIPSVIQAALGLKEEVVVYGTDLDSKDGSAVRDFVHVQDLADAHVAALNAPSGAVNLGTGTGYSVLQVIDAVQNYCGKTLSVRLASKRPGEVGTLIADNQKAAKLLNWSPKVSDLNTMIDSAWKWHQLLHENGHLIRAVLKN